MKCTSEKLYNSGRAENNSHGSSAVKGRTVIASGSVNIFLRLQSCEDLESSKQIELDR